MAKTAVVTGATAGIGAAFAERLAHDGYDVVLVARSADRLAGTAAELAERYGITATSLVADLSTMDGCAAVERRLAEQPVDLLVNNAGISLHKPFTASGVDDEERLLRLNVVTVMRLSHAALGAMRERGTGAIINVSSVAGFGPAMPGSTYPASKSWVTAFSQALGRATRGTGVRVMALCPGFTRSEFHATAGIDMSAIPSFLWLDADQVVAAALRDLSRGKIVSVPTVRYKLAATALAHIPRAILYRVPSMGGSRTRR